MNDSAEVVLAKHEVVSAADFMPIFSVDQAIEKRRLMNDLINRTLQEAPEGTTDGDYGKMPGGGKKKILFKPGAEKMCSNFGLTPQYIEDKIIEDWTGAEHGGEPLFYYSYRCQLSRGGRFMGEAIGSCNSWESKYRYRWVSEDVAKQRDEEGVVVFENLPKRGGRVSEPVFAIDKAETGGKYGKPAEYWQRFKDAITAGTAAKVKKPKKDGGTMDAWEIDATMYRLPNPEVPDTINTCQKMAQKRALVAAVLVVTNCSDAFTQDLEDFERHDTPPVATVSAEPNRGEGDRPSGGSTNLPANLPPEIQAIFEKSPPAGATGKAFEFVKRALVEAMPDNGADEYQRILDHNGIVKGKEKSLGQARNAVMQCWTMAQGLKRVAKPAPVDLGVNMSDLPYEGIPHTGEEWEEGRE